MDLGYYLPETSIAWYPSLMSPLSSFDKFRTPAKSKGIFERLREDTELRLRAKLNHVSESRLVRVNRGVPIEEKLIRKGKEKEIRLRHLIELEENKRISLMQDRPYVSPNSKAIMKSKNSSTGRLTRSIRDADGNSVGEIEKAKNQDNLEETRKNSVHNKNPSEHPAENSKPSQINLKTYQKQLIKQLEISYKLLTEKKKPKPGPLEVKCADRNYIPMFQKQAEWNGLVPKSSSINSSSIISKTSHNLLSKKLSIRPSSVLISDSAIGFEQALTYQQIIRNRIMNPQKLS